MLHTRCHDRMRIWWSLDAKKPLDFKFLLQTCEIDLFAYAILTKRPYFILKYDKNGIFFN